ncbi:MAG: hypothetical protein HGA90_05695 [Alphaproteobacteria bacterium]|nr:hypothetical protein [Alphaproteobacteria bacterium]
MAKIAFLLRNGASFHALSESERSKFGFAVLRQDRPRGRNMLFFFAGCFPAIVFATPIDLASSGVRHGTLPR